MDFSFYIPGFKRRLIIRPAYLSLLFIGLMVSNVQGVFANITCKDTEKNSVPRYLSETCLYSNISSYTIASELHYFTPNYPLWSDGANKSRWIYLPPHTQIDTTDADRWVFPVGTQFFKEFRKKIKNTDGTLNEIKVETRHLKKVRAGKGIDTWSIASYAWQQDQQDAALSKGERNVLGTKHNIPSEEDCITCHKGNVDGILGFEAIQLSDLQANYGFGYGFERHKNEWSLQTLIDLKLLSTPLKQPQLPGTEMEQKVLGYLHSNCGNCHNPSGHAAEEEADHLKFRHKLAFNTIEETDAYQTAVNQPTKNFTIAPYIVMGAQHEEMALYQSALFLRMNSIDEDYRMPMIAREVVDYEALELMHHWMLTLPTPEEYNFKFDKNKSVTNQTKKVSSKPSIKPPLSKNNFSGPGLHLQIRFDNPEAIPPVMIVYWPEDKSLKTQPVMDHKGGYFTEKLIVASKGSVMKLRNSDDVGHTIYVKDKRRNISWRLSYMPPGSGFEQELFWEEDTFVEMRCRLHLYMSAWAGSISSRYYTIINFDEGETDKDILITDYPGDFSEVKIWVPKTSPVHTQIHDGEAKQFDIGPAGKLTMTRISKGF